MLAGPSSSAHGTALFLLRAWVTNYSPLCPSSMAKAKCVAVVCRLTNTSGNVLCDLSLVSDTAQTADRPKVQAGRQNHSPATTPPSPQPSLPPSTSPSLSRRPWKHVGKRWRSVALGLSTQKRGEVWCACECASPLCGAGAKMTHLSVLQKGGVRAGGDKVVGWVCPIVLGFVGKVRTQADAGSTAAASCGETLSFMAIKDLVFCFVLATTPRCTSHVLSCIGGCVSWLIIIF
jgi:hypothetical protein